MTVTNMTRNTVQIDKLHLRIPGLSREEGQRIGTDVAEHLAQSLPSSGRRQHLGALDMRVSIRQETRRDQLGKLIAQSILEKLR